MDIEIKTLTMMPAGPGRCRECADIHAPELPHNNFGLFYQMWFNQIHKRWPTWDDATAHCSDAVKHGLMEVLDANNKNYVLTIGSTRYTRLNGVVTAEDIQCPVDGQGQ